MRPPTDLLYRPRGKFSAKRIGIHNSSEVGGFGVFRDSDLFQNYPDARRIDVRATIRDPFQNTFVRRFEQRSSIELYVIMDTSISMSYKGNANRFKIAVDLAYSFAYSSLIIGDKFGLIANSDREQPQIYLPATRSMGASKRVINELHDLIPQGVNIHGLKRSINRLSASRKMVVIISDFRWPESDISGFFNSLSSHDIIPIVLLDSQELKPPKWGLIHVRDSETKKQKIVIMRPHLHERWIAKNAEFKVQLIRQASSYARMPIFITDNFDGDLLSQKLMAI
jgi:uncharacterized protein (DUF58 family)